MNLKKLTTNSLLLGIAAVLHQITPPIILGMKPDFSLAMLFIIMLLNDDYKSCISAGFVVGILSAATTGFPGGQIPNFIDKIVTANLMFLFLKPLRNRISNQLSLILTTIAGTVVSGTVFLGSAFIMVGLPTSFRILVISIVIPATLINAVAASVLFNIINVALKRKATI